MATILFVFWDDFLVDLVQKNMLKPLCIETIDKGSKILTCRFNFGTFLKVSSPKKYVKELIWSLNQIFIPVQKNENFSITLEKIFREKFQLSI